MTSATTVIVNNISSYNCPSLVDKNNWLSTDTYGDVFEIAKNGDTIRATRNDGGGDGWCIDLSFTCCKGVLLILKCSLLKSKN